MLQNEVDRHCDNIARTRGILISRSARDLLIAALDAVITDPTEASSIAAKTRHRKLLDERADLVSSELSPFLDRLCDAADTCTVTRVTFFDMLSAMNRWIGNDPGRWSNLMVCIHSGGPAGRS